jgi:hypothetical protein
MSHPPEAVDRLRPVVAGLGWGGILPFLLLPVIAVVDLPLPLTTLLITYALLILSFLCGTLWMEEIVLPEARAGRVILSNLILLAAWPAILLPLTTAAALLALGFGVHLMVDAPWRTRGLPSWYGRLRLRLSSLATGLLVVTALLGVVGGR